ncbi:N2227-domain-containing protein [Dendrothele bispora CBS 962.96]|uniref:N2227-domain-containing protein n=1 Tax=Dendrothele bispora (strain CBS 962.96) TaxID=1314807 RepID=A0A4S8M914_DENBC|nr:N2227-domain-containing protein [Dendrothele bispora CBS 962.96]
MSRRVVRILFLLVVVGVVAVLLPRSGPLSVNLNVNVPLPVTVHIDNPSPALTFHSENVLKPIQKSPPTLKPKPLSAKQHSILSAITSFSKYIDHTLNVIAVRKERFERLPAEQRPLAEAIGYNTHFEDARMRAKYTMKFLDDVADYARELYGFAPGDIADKVYHECVSDFLAHVGRDWSSEGSQERASIFSPILDALKDGLSGVKGEKKVLVPGFGLGRLAHEIANEKDYSVDACELDYGSVIAYNYLVNRTMATFEHTVYPYITNWPFQRTAKGRFAPIRFPDMLPTSHVNLVEGDFLTEFPESEKYDAVVTLFFIYVSENIIDFLSNIHRLLKPGGLWVNLGPFKWGSFSQMQLSAEEVLDLAERLGLRVDHDSKRSIDAVYAHQVDSLLKYTYVTQFWTARKL